MGSKGGSSAPPPDPRLVEAQIRSMGFQDSAIKSIMDQAAAFAPLQKEQMQFGLDSSKTAYEQSQADRGWMLTRRDQLSGLQDKIAGDANNFNESTRGNELTAKYTADIGVAADGAMQGQARNLARRGVNPSSGAALTMGNTAALTKATAIAGGASAARDQAHGEGLALTDRASNTLAGYPAMSSQTTAAGAGFGANGLNIANAGLSGLNMGASQAAGVAGNMGSNAANMYGTMGNYKSAQDKIANDDGGAMGAFGTVAGAAITVF